MGRIEILLKQFRESFMVTDAQITLFFIIILCFIAVLIIAPFVISLLWKREVRKKAIRQYREFVEFYQLDDADENIIERLSGCLKNPWKKYLLISNPRAYISALQKYYGEIERFRAAEQSLSQKILIGDNDQNQKPTYTGQFRKNHQIIFIHENRSIIAKIVSVEDGGFICEYERGSKNLEPGDDLVILYPYGNGLAVASSIVDKVKDEKLKVVAVEMDAREYIDYDNLSVPVYIRKISLKSAFVSAQLRRIAGNEFFLQIDGHTLKKRDDVKIYFSKEKGSVPVNAEITVCRKRQIVADIGYFLQRE